MPCTTWCAGSVPRSCTRRRMVHGRRATTRCCSRTRMGFGSRRTTCQERACSRRPDLQAGSAGPASLQSQGVERRDVIIVGAGPAGSATALRLAARAPSLAAGTLLLDKAHHPRDKTCAGGVIPKASALLAALGVPFDVPQARVDGAGVALPGASLVVPGDDLCRVVRRREFDARLAGAARARGIALREGARVRHVARDGSGVRVETESESFWAPVVVGADGSGSLVRRALVTAESGVVGRAVMCDVPVAGTAWDGHDARRYDFDFRPVLRGVRGYGWAFPCWIDGLAHVTGREGGARAGSRADI